MDDLIICGATAFRYYRTPPWVLEAYPALVRPKGRHGAFSDQPLCSDILGDCISTLVTNRSERTGAQSIRHCYWQGDLPVGHIRETELGFSVVSPEMALFQLASRLPTVQATMAMMELIGRFSIFQPPESIESMLSSGDSLGLSGLHSWRRAPSCNGESHDLWMRDPVTSVAALRDLGNVLRERRGSAKFLKALNMVTGEAASPFEVQASLLFSISRKCGGEGLSYFENNAAIHLSKTAKLVSGLSKCYVDLLFPGIKEGHSIAIECQGRLAHGKGGMSIGDANRMLALQMMGIDVMPLTYEQIADEDRFSATVETLMRKMGRSYVPKSNALLKVQRNLRNQLFINWRDLGNDSPGLPI